MNIWIKIRKVWITSSNTHTCYSVLQDIQPDSQVIFYTVFEDGLYGVWRVRSLSERIRCLEMVIFSVSIWSVYKVKRSLYQHVPEVLNLRIRASLAYPLFFPDCLKIYCLIPWKGSHELVHVLYHAEAFTNQFLCLISRWVWRSNCVVLVAMDITGDFHNIFVARRKPPCHSVVEVLTSIFN